MAQGDVTWFEESWANAHEDMNLETDAFKMGLITTTPAASDPIPAWTGGTTNYQSNEVTPGGQYVADGADCLNAELTEVGGTVTFDTADPDTWTKDAANPSNALFGILYDSTTTPEYAVAFIDLGGVFDMKTGDLDVNAPASGWWSES